MMKLLWWAAALAVAVPAALVVAGQAGLLAGKAPQRLGVQDGRLQPPSRNPNSVSSQASLYADHPQARFASIAPLRFSGDGAAAMARLAALLQDTRGASLVTRQPDYLYAQCRTPLLKFTDDVEFWLDAPAGVIHFRSASRLGRSDLGANRARMETIRARFEAD